MNYKKFCCINFEQEIALFLLFKFRKEMSFINYFFEIVVPQLLEYFKENAKDVPYSLLSEVLINNKNYEKEVKEMIEKSNEISKKYIKKN
ncbi:MAG: hypothetical protein J6B64_00450 [Bacilli bacterium]|nr:hypothetical protein [Bacilli bacterium]MBP3635602.1 hypothetical protein [Bacilli bacterium]